MHFDKNHDCNGKKEQRMDMTGTIIRTGACSASHVMENDDLAQLTDTSDAWITERTGIKRRHIAEDETVSLSPPWQSKQRRRHFWMQAF